MVHLKREVAPQEEVWWGQVRGAGRPRAHLRPCYHALFKVLAQPIPGFLRGMCCGTVLLEPLALECRWIVHQPALQDPPKFRQHRLVSLSVDSLRIAAAVLEEVGPDDAPAAHGTPNCELG